jgi:hypothetical protein
LISTRTRIHGQSIITFDYLTAPAARSLLSLSASTVPTTSRSAGRSNYIELLCVSFTSQDCQHRPPPLVSCFSRPRIALGHVTPGAGVTCSRHTQHSSAPLGCLPTLRGTLVRHVNYVRKTNRPPASATIITRTIPPPTE